MGDPVRDTLREASGEVSLSVARGEVVYDEGELRSVALGSVVIDDERATIEPIRFLKDELLLRAMVGGRRGSTSMISTSSNATVSRNEVSASLCPSRRVGVHKTCTLFNKSLPTYLDAIQSILSNPVLTDQGSY